jgi:SAM-dependent methyltransferase
VLQAAAQEIGLEHADVLEQRLSDPSLRGKLEAEYSDLAQRIGEVPHFLLRDVTSGNGVEAGGNRSVEDWERELQVVIEKSKFVGMSVPGPHGKVVSLDEANPTAPVSLSLKAKHGWTPEWQFSTEDFKRLDESPDMAMYAAPRFVEHLDQVSLDRLTEAYRSIFAVLPAGDFSVLDLCSSWNSHYPRELMTGARVVVHGLNQAELEVNAAMTGSEMLVQDLNHEARMPLADQSFDVITLALSVQYLTNPLSVFAEMHRLLKPGGLMVVAFSHRCFIEKCVNVWAKETYDGEGHANLICDYFSHGPRGGWTKLSTADVSPRQADPVWLVTAVKA